MCFAVFGARFVFAFAWRCAHYHVIFLVSLLGDYKLSLGLVLYMFSNLHPLPS